MNLCFGNNLVLTWFVNKNLVVNSEHYIRVGLVFSVRLSLLTDVASDHGTTSNTGGGSFPVSPD